MADSLDAFPLVGSISDDSDDAQIRAWLEAHDRQAEAAARTQRLRLPSVFIAAGLLLIAVALYDVSLTFPFHGDDVPIFSAIQSVSVGEILTQANSFDSYYRPLTNALYKVAMPAWGWYSLVLFTHLLNIALTLQLVRRFGALRRTWLTTATIACVIPFVAQALFWITSYVHLLVTFCILCTILLAMASVETPSLTRRILLLLAALLLAMLAPFVHENGVLTAPLLLVAFVARYNLTELRQRLTSQRLLFALLLGLPLATGVVFWLIRASMLGGSSGVQWQHLLENGAFVLQWLTYPVQMLFGSFDTLLAGNSQIVVAVASLIGLTLAMTIAAYLSDRQANRVALAMGLWVTIAVLPAVLFLHAAYVGWSERLLYLSFPAMAILYGSLLARLWERYFWVNTAVVVVASLLLVTATRDQFIEHARLHAQLFDAVAMVQDDDALLFINLPASTETRITERSALLTPRLPLTPAHAFMLTEVATVEDFIALNTGRRVDAVALQLPERAPRLANQAIQLYGNTEDLQQVQQRIGQSDGVWMTDTSDGRFVLLGVGQRPGLADDAPDIAPDAEALAAFDAGIVLQAVRAVRDGDSAYRIRLLWQMTDANGIADMAQPPPVEFVHLTCDGVIVAQYDGAPLNNLLPFDQWPAGERWWDGIRLDTAPPAAASTSDDNRDDEVSQPERPDVSEDCLTLQVGLYDAESGVRDTVVPGGVATVQDDAVTVRLRDLLP